jgi:hypothetical protein
LLLAETIEIAVLKCRRWGTYPLVVANNLQARLATKAIEAFIVFVEYGEEKRIGADLMGDYSSAQNCGNFCQS